MVAQIKPDSNVEKLLQVLTDIVVEARFDGSVPQIEFDRYMNALITAKAVYQDMLNLISQNEDLKISVTEFVTAEYEDPEEREAHGE